MGTDNRKGALYAIFTASLWGFMAIVLKVITSELSPVTVVWFRFAIAFVVLGIWTLIFRKADFRIFQRPPFLLIVTAIFLAMNYLGFIAGIKYVSPSSSQVFIQIAPVSFALSGIIIFREHVNWKHIVGFILVLSGIGLFYSEQLRELAAGGEHFTRGMLLVFQLALLRSLFTLDTTFFRLFIKRPRQNRRATAYRQLNHRNYVLFFTTLNTQFVTNIKRTTGFCTVAVEMHLATRYRFTGDRTGFEKPCCPKPFIQSYR